MKLSAQALASRGLLVVGRNKGVWTARLTDAGRYFAEHGEYPPAPPKSERKTRPSRRSESPKEPEAPATDLASSNPSTTPDPPPVENAEPMTESGVARQFLQQQVERPYLAVRELRDRPRRLPKFARQRCLLVAHSLVVEALARGWKITPVPAETWHDPWGSKSVRYEHSSLLLIDAGSAPIGLIFDEVQRRVPHEDTKEEAAQRAKGQYVWASSYDHVAAGKLRLHLTNNDRKFQPNYTDTARVLVEDRLPAILDAIEEATKQALRRDEMRRVHLEDQVVQQRERERIAGLREQYEQWETDLVEGAKIWSRHVEMREYLAAIEQDPPEGVDAFIAWAHGYLEATDPRFKLPKGGQPEWPHRERVRTGRYARPQYRV